MLVIVGIGGQHGEQLVHAAEPDESVASALAAHAVAIETLDEHAGDGVVVPTLVAGEAGVEEPVEPLVGHAGSVQGDRVDGQAQVRHARVAGDAAVLARLERFEEQVILDVPADGLDAVLIAKLVRFCLGGREGDQVGVVLDCRRR